MRKERAHGSACGEDIANLLFELCLRGSRRDLEEVVELGFLDHDECRICAVVLSEFVIEGLRSEKMQSSCLIVDA